MLILAAAGCHKDDSPVAPPPAGSAARYGSGSVAFVGSDSSRIAVTGKYKPSALFASDTAGEGAGGFIRDTTIGGVPIVGELMGYSHTLRNGLQDMRLLVLSLQNDAHAPGEGTYAFVHGGETGSGPAVSLLYESYIDSLGEYNVYESDSGSVTLSVYDATRRHLAGYFSGRLRLLAPDTAVKLTIAYGAFDITCTGAYFAY